VDELKKSEDRLRVLIENHSGAGLDQSTGWVNDFVNRRWLEYTGMSLQQMQSAEAIPPIHPKTSAGIWLSGAQPWLLARRLKTKRACGVQLMENTAGS